MRSLRKRIKSSSLVEVVIAMSILAIVISIILGVLYRLSGNQLKQRLRSFEVLNQVLIETKKEKSYLSTEEEINGFTVIKSVEVFGDGLLKLTLEAKQGKRTITEIEEVVHEE